MSAAIAHGDCVAVDCARDAFAGTEWKLVSLGEFQSAFASRQYMAVASGCSLAYSRPRPSAATSFARVGGQMLTSARLAFGQRAGFVDDQRIDFFRGSRALRRS